MTVPRGVAALCLLLVPIAPYASTSTCTPPEVVRWQHGDGPKRLLPADAGFCYLSGLGGNFEGGGEAVRVYVDDGVWWVAGRSCQPSLWAEVTCVRWAAVSSMRRRRQCR